MSIRTTEALEILQDEFGADALECFATESVVPGVCMNCSAINDACEPDATRNWCDSCNRPKVRSWLVLAEVI